MKLKNIKIITSNLVILLLFITLTSCICQKKMDYPVVESATYHPYDINGERGYIVKFKLSNDLIQPEAVILNKIKKRITPADKNGLKYRINVIAQTRKIENYRIEGNDLDNGILFSGASDEQFKAVDFKLKK